MRTVMRLEHPSTGRGPYKFMHYHTDPMDRDVQPAMNPGGGHQPGFGVDHPNHYKYGFTSVAQAEAWWDKTARMSAARNGYQLAVYSVPEEVLIEDFNQCAFDPTVAKLVAHISPAEWVTGDLNMLLQAAKEQAQCGLPTVDSLPSVRTSITKARPQLSVEQFKPESNGLPWPDLPKGSVSGRFSASVPNTQQIPRSRGR